MRQVTAAVIVEDNRVLLARRAPGQKLAGYWELPGGKLEDGETPQTCLERELLEELSMNVQPGRVLGTTVFHYEHGSFEMLAVEAVRLSEYTLSVHDAVCWASRSEVQGLQLAPADVDLIREILGWQ